VVTGPDTPEPVEIPDELAHKVGTVLAAAARVALAHADVVDRHPVVREMASEFAGLLDVMTGIAVTSPEGRKALHVTRLRALQQQLPALDGGAGNGAVTP
jgi:hypothetical protein